VQPLQAQASGDQPMTRSGMLLPLLTVAVVFYMLGALFGVREKKDEPPPAPPPSCATPVRLATEPLEAKLQTALGQLHAAESAARVPERPEKRRPELWSGQPPQRSAGARAWAYVTMVHDASGGAGGAYMWGVVAIARQLQLLSEYPLVLLTDVESFLDGTSIAKLHVLGVNVMPLEHLEPPRKLEHSRWRVAWWKMQIWKLTQYERLIWLDSDAVLYRSVDYLFERPWMYAQQDDWFCKFKKAGMHMCSGIMLLFPNISDFYGLRDYSAAEGVELKKGDQGVIQEYFKRTGRPISLLSGIEAAFGQCVAQLRTAYLLPDGEPVLGLWAMPAFVHKSGGWAYREHAYYNVCFQHNISQQLFTVDGITINVCHFNPMAVYWRDSFCEALSLLDVWVPSAKAFCSDDCWRRGVTPTGLDLAMSCGPLSPSVATDAYEAGAVGAPESMGPLLARRLLAGSSP